MSIEKTYNLAFSIMPSSAVELAAKQNGVVIAHLATNETLDGDSRSLIELKATFHRMTAETAKPLFDAATALGSLAQDVKAMKASGSKASFVEVAGGFMVHDLTQEQYAACQDKIIAAIASLRHPKLS